MRRLVMLLAVASNAVLIGCSGGEVVVEAQLAGQLAGNGAAGPAPLGDLVVRLLPYDRDQIFDSLATAYPDPQPPIPDSLQQIRQAVAQAQTEWQRAQDAWNVARDSLQNLSNAMEGLSRSSAEYRLMFADFGELESREQSLRNQMDEAFARFTALQEEFANGSEQVRLRREQWADEAFSSIETVISTRLEELDREELADTTGTAGLAPFEVPPGRWWVHARYDLPYEELYWNIPIEVARGDSVRIQLTQENAQVRPNM